MLLFWKAAYRPAAGVLTVDSEIIGHSHGADWVADLTQIGAVVGAVNPLYGHRPVVDGEADAAARAEESAALHPQPGADGAGGLAAQAGRVLVLDQGVCGAADGGSSDVLWWQNKRVDKSSR